VASTGAAWRRAGLDSDLADDPVDCQGPAI